MTRLACLLSVVAVLGTSCGGDTASETTAAATPTTQAAASASSACDSASETAASVGDMQDTVDDLYPAIQACDTVEEWAAASKKHLAALDGADPEVFLTNVCLYSAPPAIAQTRLCQSVG